MDWKKHPGLALVFCMLWRHKWFHHESILTGRPIAECARCGAVRVR